METLLQKIAILEKELIKVKNQNQALSKRVARLSKHVDKQSKLLKTNKLSLVSIVKLEKVHQTTPTTSSIQMLSQINTTTEKKRLIKGNRARKKGGLRSKVKWHPRTDTSRDVNSENAESAASELDTGETSFVADSESEETKDSLLPLHSSSVSILKSSPSQNGGGLSGDEDSVAKPHLQDTKRRRVVIAADKVKKNYWNRRRGQRRLKDQRVLQVPKTEVEKRLVTFVEEIAKGFIKRGRYVPDRRIKPPPEELKPQLKVPPNGWDSCEAVLLKRISNFADMVVKENPLIFSNDAPKTHNPSLIPKVSSKPSKNTLKPVEKSSPTKEEHSKKSEFICKVCAKTLSCATTLKLHLQAHEGDKPHVCNLCGACFAIEASWKRHLLIHQEKNEKCPECGKTFRRRDDMRKHIQRVHEKVTRFSCSMCPKKFSDSSGKIRHERRHLGIKLHLCVQCGRKFPEGKNLKLHMESQHSGLEKPNRVKLIIDT